MSSVMGDIVDRVPEGTPFVEAKSAESLIEQGAKAVSAAGVLAVAPQVAIPWAAYRLGSSVREMGAPRAAETNVLNRTRQVMGIAAATGSIALNIDSVIS